MDTTRTDTTHSSSINGDSSGDGVVVDRAEATPADSMVARGSNGDAQSVLVQPTDHIRRGTVQSSYVPPYQHWEASQPRAQGWHLTPRGWTFHAADEQRDVEAQIGLWPSQHVAASSASAAPATRPLQPLHVGKTTAEELLDQQRRRRVQMCVRILKWTLGFACAVLATYCGFKAMVYVEWQVQHDFRDGCESDVDHNRTLTPECRDALVESTHAPPSMFFGIFKPPKSFHPLDAGDTKPIAQTKPWPGRAPLLVGCVCSGSVLLFLVAALAHRCQRSWHGPLRKYPLLLFYATKLSLGRRWRSLDERLMETTVSAVDKVSGFLDRHCRKKPSEMEGFGSDCEGVAATAVPSV